MTTSLGHSGMVFLVVQRWFRFLEVTPLPTPRAMIGKIAEETDGDIPQAASPRPMNAISRAVCAHQWFWCVGPGPMVLPEHSRHALVAFLAAPLDGHAQVPIGMSDTGPAHIPQSCVGAQSPHVAAGPRAVIIL